MPTWTTKVDNVDRIMASHINDLQKHISWECPEYYGARVVDARLADTPNSGDATTDGLIDALRDAMIAHGLIAAS